MHWFKNGLFFSLSCLFSFTLLAQEEENILLDELEIVGNINAQRPYYKATAERVLDIIHMDLNLKIDWEQQQLPATAKLLCTPYAKNLDSLVLDAKGLAVKSVDLLQKGQSIPLTFNSNDLFLTIKLLRPKLKTDTFELAITYTAKPYQRKASGGAAITDARGLYFINAQNKDKNKFRHLWTQGEPENNSAWFPTIDKPNEKFTHEISITVDTSLVTLSNGLIDFVTLNGDGTRTDYWVMDKPHAPYLVMLAVGKFSVVHDHWKDLDVDYYVEKEWADKAQRIFGNTPEMLSYFSDLFGVDYPWQKYSQVVVRDYVSGAMENTTAVVFGDQLYTDSNAVNDQTHEDVVAHELVHHWFGDLVTCENWGNLPLNESFATYGEYLWIDKKYGNNEAEWHLKTDLENYLYEYYSGHQEKLIRTDWNDPQEMFDHHSYAKGARVLHMLRHELGDETFFEGLRIYLTDYAYQATEIHQLRLAFEKASGQDLNWFFDQWFLAKGHPQLEITYDFNKTSREQKVTIKQVQSLSIFPLYKLQSTLDVYTQRGKKSYPVTIDQQEQTFTYKIVGLQPRLVVFNANKALLCETDDQKPESFWVNQLSVTKELHNRHEAMMVLGRSNNSRLKTIALSTALKDRFWGIRNDGLGLIYNLNNIDAEKLKDRVTALALNDSNTTVRASAIRLLADFYNVNDENLYTNAMKVKSYYVKSAALQSLGKYNYKSAFVECKKWIKQGNPTMVFAAVAVLTDYGDKSALKWVEEALENASTNNLYYLLNYPAEFAIAHPDQNKKALSILEFYTQHPNDYIAKRALHLKESVLRELQRLEAESKAQNIDLKEK